MPTVPPTFKASWAPKRSELRKAADERRGTARARGYDTKWDQASTGYLAKHPLCVCCLANGAQVAAEVTDHIEPHRGNKVLFWSRRNWQPLCAWCHNHVKKVIERLFLAGMALPAELRLDRKLDLWRPPVSR